MSFPIPVAPFLHIVTPLRLGVLEAGPHTGNATEGETDGYRVRLRPLSGAYVCFVPASFDEMRGSAEFLATIGLTTSVLAGRANAAGHVLISPDWEAEPENVAIRELEHPLCSWACEPPTALNVVKVGSSWADPADQARVRGAAPSRLFWTYDTETFRAFLEALWLPTNPDGSEPSDAERRASFDAAVALHWLFEFGHTPRPPLPLLDLPTLGADERLRVQELLLVRPARTQHHLAFGHLDDDRFTVRDRMGYPHAGVIYDATPPALRALYAAEWVARCVVHLRKQSAEDWATLHRAGEVARAYSDCQPVREQELALFGSFGVPKHGGVPSAHAPGGGGGSLPVVNNPDEIHVWVEALREFAHTCAQSQVERRDFNSLLGSIAASVDGSLVSPPNTRGALRQLAVTLGPRLATHAQLSAATRDATLDYFDVYAYGKTLQEAGLRAECDAYAEGIDEAVRWVSAKAERLLRDHLPYDEFALALWTRVPDDAARKALHRRFELVHLGLEVPFWKASVSLERWDALRPALAWMRSAISRAGSVWSAFIAEEVHAYAKLLQDADAANQMLNFLYRHHRARMGEPIRGTAEATHTVWKRIVQHRRDFQIDFDAGRVHVLTEHGATAPAVRFVQRVTRAAVVRDTTRHVSTPLGRRLQPAIIAPAVVDFTVEVPADTTRWHHNAPTYLKAFANTLNMGLILTALHAETRRLDVYTCVDLSQGVLATVDHIGSVLYAWNRPPGTLTPLAALEGGVLRVERANQLYRWAAQAGRAAGVVSVLADLLGGLRVFEATTSSRDRILRGEAEGDVADAARRGDDVLYSLYVAQGTLKLLSGTGGALMLATGVTTGLLAVGVLTCGVLVLVCDGAIAVHHANQPAVTAFVDRVYRARERELQHIERGGNADGETGVSRTAQRIATLNARLRDALDA